MQFLRTQKMGSFFFAAMLALPLWLSPQQNQPAPTANGSYSTQQQSNPQYQDQQNPPQAPPPNAPNEQPAPPPRHPPTIGTVNYLEGQVYIGNEALSPSSAGDAVLQEGQSLTTQNGKAEILLTPGVFLRVGDNSAVRMISPSLSNTEVAVDRGDATLEVTQIQKENEIVVDLPGGNVSVLKKGFYDFDGNQNTVRVFKGEAQLLAGNKNVKIKENHQVALNDPKLKPREFKKEQYDTEDLYRWSVLRSSYLAEANVDAASRYVNSPTFVPGWYWDPWFASFTWVPGDGIFYSPFGWGFYSPFYVYEAPFFYYGYYGGPYRRHFDRDFHAWSSGPHYGPHPMWHGSAGGVRPGGGVGGGHAYRGFGGGFHGGGGFGGGMHGGGGAHGH